MHYGRSAQQRSSCRTGQSLVGTSPLGRCNHQQWFFHFSPIALRARVVAELRCPGRNSIRSDQLSRSRPPNTACTPAAHRGCSSLERRQRRRVGCRVAFARRTPTSTSMNDVEILPPPAGPALPISMISAVPKRITDRILNGEFIDFNDLLPEALALSSASPIQVHVGSERLHLVQEHHSPERVKRHMHDYATWSEAWTAYLFVVVSSSPRWTQELLAYQAIITDCNQKYSEDDWLAYDRQFRAAAASNPRLRWDVIEPTIWQLTLTNKARPVCFACRLAHPYSGRCPFRAGPRPLLGSPRPFGGSLRSTDVCINY